MQSSEANAWMKGYFELQESVKKLEQQVNELEQENKELHKRLDQEKKRNFVLTVKNARLEKVLKFYADNDFSMAKDVLKEMEGVRV
jgi:regulator of replication initiation timing